MKTLFFLVFGLLPLPSFALSLEHSIENAVYRVGVAISGGLAQQIWETELAKVETAHSRSEGGTAIRAWAERKTKNLQCVAARYSDRVEYSCNLFAPHLLVEEKPVQAHLSLGNFKRYDNRVALLSKAEAPAAKTKGIESKEATKVETVILEGDFAQAILEGYLKEVKGELRTFSNAKELTKEKDTVSCQKHTVEYEGERVRTEYRCWLRGINKILTIPGGTKLKIEEDSLVLSR